MPLDRPVSRSLLTAKHYLMVDMTLKPPLVTRKLQVPVRARTVPLERSVSGLCAVSGGSGPLNWSWLTAVRGRACLHSRLSCTLSLSHHLKSPSGPLRSTSNAVPFVETFQVWGFF